MSKIIRMRIIGRNHSNVLTQQPISNSVPRLGIVQPIRSKVHVAVRTQLGGRSISDRILHTLTRLLNQLTVE
jgi:hypothetical protein